MTARSPLILVFVLVLLLGVTTAQTRIVVNPAANATVEANSRISFPFAGTGTMRYQQICSLKGTPGLISKVAFRRDNDVIVSSGDYVAFAVTMDLSLSTSPRTAATMSATFAANMGKDAKQVYTGTLNWPAQKKVPPGPTSFAYTVPLPAPFFLFTGQGDLCLDIVKRSSTNVQSTYFGMDADSSGMGTGFAATKLGEGCPGAGKSEVLVYSNWFPGARAKVLLWKAPSNLPTFFIAGTSTRRYGPLLLPFDLAPIGAPNCKLYTNIVVPIAGTTTSRTTPYSSRWDLFIDLPLDTALSGAKFPVQFLMFQDTLIGNAANLSVSQGWEITMGTLVPGQPPQSEAHASSLTAAQASLVQAGYGMVVELTM